MVTDTWSQTEKTKLKFMRESRGGHLSKRDLKYKQELN